MFATAPPELLTPQAALSWEFWRRGRFELLKMVLAGLTVPLILSFTQYLFRLRLTWDGHSQAIPQTEWPPAAHMATLFVQTMVAVFLPIGLLSTFDRHWILPVPTRDLIRLRLVHGSMLVALAMVIGGLSARVILWTDWPIMVPALYAVTGWTAALWIQSRFKGRELATTLAALLAALILYSGLHSHLIAFEGGEVVQRPFRPSGTDEVGLLICAIILCVWGATRSAELERCGLAGSGSWAPPPRSGDGGRGTARTGGADHPDGGPAPVSLTIHGDSERRMAA